MQTLPVPYCGSAPDPVEMWTRWNLDPALLVALVAAFVAGRAFNARPLPLMAFCAIAFLLFVSPLCALGSALFSVRVVHHLVLTTLAAPLLAWALPGSGRGLTGWTGAHAVIFWAWHSPAAYALALASDAMYWFMQLTLLGSAIGFWRAVRSAPPTTGVAALLVAMVQMGLLGALLTFTPQPLYAWHMVTTQSWGLTPLEDQQLAGLIMWVAGAGLYLAAALRLANNWLTGRQAATA